MGKHLPVRVWCALAFGLLSLSSGAWGQGSGTASSSAGNPDRGTSTSGEQAPGSSSSSNAAKAQPGEAHSSDKPSAPDSVRAAPGNEKPDPDKPSAGDAAHRIGAEQNPSAQRDKAQASVAPAPAANAPTPNAIPEDNPAGDYGEQTPSLGDIARKTRQARRSQATTSLDSAESANTAPAGFQSFMLQYCVNPDRCSEASILIPENAEVLSRTNGQHIFKTVLNGDPVMLYAGPADVNAPYRSLSDADYIRMRNLANPFGPSREKADALSAQALTIEGRSATITRFRYQREPDASWIGERALIEMPDGQFMLVCTAPEQHFAAAEALCTTLLNSLRLP